MTHIKIEYPRDRMCECNKLLINRYQQETVCNIILGRVFRIREVYLKNIENCRIYCQEKLKDVQDGFWFNKSTPHGPTSAN